MRPLSELLQLVYDEFNRLVYNDTNLVHPGLCSSIYELYFRGKIFVNELKMLKKYIRDNRPRNASKTNILWFEAYLIVSRNKWLLKHIKINKLKENGKSKN